MADLCIDYDTLQATERDLQCVKNEFETCTRHQNDLRGVWGSGEVADAMSDFVDNWDRHRKELLQQIEDVGTMVSTTIETFRQTDNGLADVFKGD